MFSVTVLRDERIVVVAEQRPDSTEEDSFQWMSRVLQVLNPQNTEAVSIVTAKHSLEKNMLFLLLQD